MSPSLVLALVLGLALAVLAQPNPVPPRPPRPPSLPPQPPELPRSSSTTAPASQVTVSGLSAGAYFATQYQFAHSSTVGGAAIFAGGPYFCAMDTMGMALTACMNEPQLIELNLIADAIKGFNAVGAIDPLTNLAKHRVYIFSGTEDTIVHPDVVKALEQQYRDFGVTQIQTVYNIADEHAFPTISSGNPCSYDGQPWINNCTYDGAGVALQWLLGKLKPRTTAVAKNLMSIDQSKFTNGVAPSKLSLAQTGYYYMPTGCQKKNANCRIHVAFHGCQQYYGNVGNVFLTTTGYNEWAESNNIIILYPQTTASEFEPENPEGCWDWWGYLDYQYALKSGRQIAFVNAMIQYFASQ